MADFLCLKHLYVKMEMVEEMSQHYWFHLFLLDYFKLLKNYLPSDMDEDELPVSFPAMGLNTGSSLSPADNVV